jgi:hypothetical protein
MRESIPETDNGNFHHSKGKTMHRKPLPMSILRSSHRTALA